MSPDGPITITLPNELSSRIRAKIAESGYKDTVEVIQGGIDALDNIHDLEPWMIAEIIATCDEIDADPSQLRTMDQVDETLAKQYQQLLKAG